VSCTHCRDFRKASSRIGQALKGETQSQAGRRDLAQLSPWFEHFTSPTGGYFVAHYLREGNVVNIICLLPICLEA
jgi:hypothetical protein